MTLLEVLGRSRDLGFLGPGPVERHVEHAAAFAAAVPTPPPTFLDLGSGGGVPGLILALTWDSAAVLLDAQAKRGAFLREACASLGLEDVEVVVARAEVAGRDPALRGRFEVVTSRGFGPPPATAECGGAFLADGGVLLVAEPPDAPADRWPAGLAELGLADDGVVVDGEAHVRRLRRTAPLPDRYPRRDGIPARRPLWPAP